MLALGALVLGAAGAGCSSSASGSASGSGGADGGSDFDDASTSSSGGSGGPRDGASDGVAGSCFPADVSTFKAQWKHATKFYQGACTTKEQIDAFGFQYFGVTPPDGGPDASAPVPQACADCIATDDTADAYGAIIVHRGWVEPNVPGCIANAMDDPTGVKCAGALQAASMCELAACGANCPVTSDATLSAYDQCAIAADTAQCKTFATDAECANNLGDAGAEVDMCLAGNSFVEAYKNIAWLFCGTSAVDAGGGG